MTKLAVYIHWPFCVSKCPYCDFNSRPLADGEDETLWAAAYEKEIDVLARQVGERLVTSVYFGGGTPSLMKPETVASVLASIQKRWSFAEDCEITIEANPSSSEIEKFKAFKLSGINRLSLGVQSFDDGALRFLGRAHDAAQACRAIDAAAHSFDRWSFDLIYARAGQTESSWRQELDQALSFAPRHLSLYQLTIEEGTVFYKKAKSETLQLDEEPAAKMYEETQDRLTAAGLPPYEISNYAALGQESRHNLTYWRYGDYLGIGPGAHGRFVDAAGKRHATANERNPRKWMELVCETGSGATEEATLSLQDAKTEALLMGLRLVAGLSFENWHGLFGTNLTDDLSAHKLAVLKQDGLLLQNETALALTNKGRQRLDAVLRYLV